MTLKPLLMQPMDLCREEMMKMLCFTCSRLWSINMLIMEELCRPVKKITPLITYPASDLIRCVPPADVSVCLPVPSACRPDFSVSVSHCLSLFLCLCLSLMATLLLYGAVSYLSHFPSIYPSLYPSSFLSRSLSLSLPLYLCLSLSLTLSLSVSLSGFRSLALPL